MVFGILSSNLLAFYDRQSSSWRTCQMSLIWGSPKYAERWPKSGMICNGELFRLHQWELPICGGDGSLLPTPVTSGHYFNRSPGSTKKRYLLIGLARRKMLPTPLANTAKKTPSTPSAWKRNSSLNTEAAKIEGFTQETIGKDSRLNPEFVEEMMGFPIGWSELDP